jgi:hypothetical protein
LNKRKVLMRIAHVALSLFVVDPLAWSSDWAWGIPLIVLTVVIHVLGLGLVGQRAAGVSSAIFERHHPTVVFVAVVGTTTLWATCLHALEAGLWAAAYRFLGALQDQRSAMLYSLNAITSYGHTAISLDKHWELMGALEALNGWLLFGLTTAFLFAMIAEVWSLGARDGRR